MSRELTKYFLQDQREKGGEGARHDLREGMGKPCLTWREYRPNTEAEHRRESKLAEIFTSDLLKDGDLDVACINRLREERIPVAESCLQHFKDSLNSGQVYICPSTSVLLSFVSLAQKSSLSIVSEKRFYSSSICPEMSGLHPYICLDLIYWYKSTNSDAAGRTTLPLSVPTPVLF